MSDKNRENTFKYPDKHPTLSSDLSRRSFGGLMMGGTFALTGCSSEVLGGKRVLYATDSQSNGYPTVEAVRAMGAYLNEKTNGRLSVKLYPGGQLGSEGSTLEIAMFGGLDLTRTFSAALNNIAPLTKLFSLPFLFRSTDHQRRVIDSEIGDTIMKSLESFGLRGIAIYDTGGRGFYNTERLIPEPAALKGQKIRVPNSDIFLATMRALGANPTPMNFSEVYQGLVQNVIDGAENNWPAYISTRHYEVAPNFSETGHFRTPDMLIMSLRTWNSFSEEDQAIILEAARHSVGVMRGLWDASVEDSKKALLASGGEILSDIDSGPFRALMGPVYEQFVTPELQSYVTRIDQMGEQGT
ncbi:MAG: TRAP transporter substrate-binding protein [Litorimonas sp.]